MALETGNHVSDLVATNPTNTDAVNAGDDHIRLIKNAVKNTLLNLVGALFGEVAIGTTTSLALSHHTKTIRASAAFFL
jgi:hypothetical protein